MAHEIDTMMYVGAVPWHGLGKFIGNLNVDSDQALVAAGLDWEVSKDPVYVNNPGELAEIPNVKAIKRLDNNRVLSVMSDGYKPVQNKGKFKFFDEVVGQKLAVYHTAMSLDEGRKVALLAELPGEIVVKNDGPIKKYLLLADSFDGSLAFSMMMCNTRVVCANTLNVALAEGTRNAYKLRHSINIENRVQEAQKVLGFAIKQNERFGEAANALVDLRFSDEMMKKLAATLFPANEENVLSKQAAGAREAVLNLFENGKGHAGIRGSAWAAINAVAEFADHDKQTRSTGGRGELESRARALLFGAAANLKQKAVNTVYQLAA